MELLEGMTFTGTGQCFSGRIEALEIDKNNNRLRVGLTQKHETFVPIGMRIGILSMLFGALRRRLLPQKVH